MACGDVLSLEDLQTAKKHQIFEAEVITGKAGGVAGGATIGTATNPVTGQTQQTLPSILADLGFDVQSWTSSTGGVLASANQVFLNDTPGSLGLGDYYAWGGTFPKTVPAGTDPALVGSGYIMRSSRLAGVQAREALRRSYAEAGYNLVAGSFEAGGTLVKANDVLLQERTGKAFSGSAGPVAPGTNPVGSIDWVPRADKTLRVQSENNDLELWSKILDEIEIKLVGTFEAGCNVTASNQAVLHLNEGKCYQRASGGNFTVNPNTSPDSSWVEVEDNYVYDHLVGCQALLSTMVRGSGGQLGGECVITGDSLALSGFGYPAGSGVVGSGYATDNPFGMSSWPHLLRDIIFSSAPGFTPIHECAVMTDATISYPSNYAQFMLFGMNANVISVSFATDQTAAIQAGYSGNKSLIVSYADTVEAVNFKVNGVVRSNLSPDGKYKSGGYMVIPFTGSAATISEVTKVSDGTPGYLNIYGLGSTSHLIPKLTAKGGYSSGQINNEFNSLVGSYSPQLVLYMIGANDIALNVPPSQFKQNLLDFVASLRAVNSDANVLFISTTPATTFPRHRVRPYLMAMMDAARETGNWMLDVYTRFSAVPAGIWRFDNIHFTKGGDNIMLSMVLSEAFGSTHLTSSAFTAQRELYLGAGGALFNSTRSKFKKSVVVIVQATTTTPTISGTDPNIADARITASYVTQGGITLMRVTTAVGKIISLMPLDGSASMSRQVVRSMVSLGTWDVGLHDGINLLNVNATNRFFVFEMEI